MVTLDQQENVLSSQNLLLWIVLEIRYFIYRYAELNHLLVGSGLIPLIIELQQDDHTVCCGHIDVVNCFASFRAWTFTLCMYCYLTLWKKVHVQAKKEDFL